jgi:DNA-binding GntR family transcriptional regulator
LPGTKLQVEFLSKRYSAGASPVREALNRLLADGIVEREDQRGFIAAPVSREELAELMRTRCWLEEVALCQSVEHGGEEWMDQLALELHRLNRTPRSLSTGDYETNPEWERRHVLFHQALLSACGSRWLVAYCDQLRQLAYRYRQFAAAKAYPRRDERAEHESIFEAVMRRDCRTAARLLTEHYQRTTDVILSSENLFAPDAAKSRRHGRPQV